MNGEVYSDHKIVTVRHVEVARQHDYGFLTKIKVLRSDGEEYIFSEVDYPRLLNEIEYICWVVKKRVEDVDIGIESYQVKLNLTKPDCHLDGILNIPSYTMK
ncbi:hypothetical protein Tco_1260646, partial [Tanacetum coccineum]